MRRMVLVPLTVLTAYAPCPHDIVAQTDPVWDVSQPRGKTREIDFTTTEGTWMSLDISPDGKWIVFDLLANIYRVPSIGGEAENLTETSGIAVNYHPRYSPDGQSIAFISDRGGQDNLWIMNANGSAPRPIHVDLNARVVEPAWSPDGQWILATLRLPTVTGFYRTTELIWKFPRQGGAGLPVVQLEASGSSVPARAGFWSGNDRLQWPSMSPDGRYVYFHSSLFAGVDRHIKRVEMETGHVDDITESKNVFLSCCGRPAYPSRLGEVAPEVSPDGHWLAFARKMPGGKTSVGGQAYLGRTALWLRDLQTGADRVVMDPITSDAMELHPAWDHRVLPGYSWAKDGRSIVLSQGGKLRRLWIETGRVETIPFHARVHRTIAEMAQGKHRISDRAFDSRFLRWPTSSPDGRRLVFESVGQLWTVDLPSGVPRPLIPWSSGTFASTPTWSPDGNWIAYTTWSDTEGGQLWKVAASGGSPERLAHDAGRYFYPAWSPDGQSVVTNRWAAEMSYQPGAPGWQLVRLPAAGGIGQAITAPGALGRSGVGANGRVYLLAGSDLLSFAADGSDRKKHATFASPPNDAVPSPDGRWLAIEAKQDVYVMPFPPVPPTGNDVKIDVESADPTMQRLTREGGQFPRWRNLSTVETVSANRYIAYDVQSGKADSLDIHLTIPKDVPPETIALTGARLVTLDHRKVIERGTIVVTAGRITCLGTCSIARASHVIAVDGKTVIPGLVDVHAHQSEDGDGLAPLAQHRPSSASYLAYGVTTVHDPSAAVETSFSIGELIDAGRLIGPRTFSTGVAITCSPTDDLRDIHRYQDAEEHFDRATRQGAISIKDYKQCTRVQREMLEDIARKRGVTITSEGADPIYLLGLIMGGSTGWEHPIQYHPFYSDFARFFGKAGAHYSAQLILSDYPHGNAMEYWFSQNDLWRDPKAMRWNPWEKIASRHVMVKKPLEEYIFPILAQNAASIKREGGYLPVGAHGEQQGLGTHWEIWSYAMGLTPMEALEAGSLDGAHFLGLDQDIGSLAVGKLADLVVLNSNPLQNIRRTTDIKFVMKAGRLYDAESLDEIWPTNRPYGVRPWSRTDVTRTDTRADTYWDGRETPSVSQIKRKAKKR